MVSSLSPKPDLGQRSALEPAHTRRLPLIFHPCAAWQESEQDYVQLSMHGKGGESHSGRVPRSVLRGGAGAVFEYLQQRQQQQHPPPATLHGSRRSRKRARGG